MAFLSLPNESIINIISWIQLPQALHGLCCTNRRLHSISKPELYQRDAQYSHPYSSAVSWAAEHGMMGLLQTALHYGAVIPPHSITNDRKHPLMLATQNGHDDIVNFLFESGCDPNMHDTDGYSLLSLAIIGQHLSLVKLLLNRGFRRDRGNANSKSPIQLAAFYGNEKIVEQLLSVPPNNPRNLPGAYQMENALDAAMKAGHKHLFMQLLDGGVHAGHALLKAVDRRNPDYVEILVDRADRELSTIALSQAVGQENITIVKILLAKRVSCEFGESDQPNSHSFDSCKSFKTPYDIPPIVRAVTSGNVALVRLLIAHGADVNAGYHNLRRVEQLQEGQTCGRVVWLAMELRHQEIVHLLLKSGADINLKPLVWRQSHVCHCATREVHLRVMAGLRAASRKEMDV